MSYFLFKYWWGQVAGWTNGTRLLSVILSFVPILGFMMGLFLNLISLCEDSEWGKKVIKQ